MNIKFVATGLIIIGALFWGTEIYWAKQFEQQARDHFKSMAFIQQMNEAMSRAGYPIKVDALNQYPHVLVYVTLTEPMTENVNRDDLRGEMEKAHHQMTCGYFDYIQEKEASDKYKDIGKGVVKVIEEDQPATTYFFKTYDGNVLYEKKQILSECSEFFKLKQSIGYIS